MHIQTRIELKRGCGYRKTGAGGVGLYFVGDPFSRGCGRLPFPLHDCPTCGGGVRQHRGAQWIEPQAFFGGDYGTPAGKLLSRTLEYLGLIESPPVGGLALRASIEAALSPPHPCNLPRGCFAQCPLAPAAMSEKAILMWVGEKHYPSAAGFLEEAARLGVSKRLGALPRGWKPGDIVYLAHPGAVMPWHRGWTAPDGVEYEEVDTALGTLGGAFEPAQVARPGVFSAFQPKLEVVLDTDDPDEAPKYAHELAERFGDDVEFIKVERAPEPVQAAMDIAEDGDES